MTPAHAARRRWLAAARSLWSRVRHNRDVAAEDRNRGAVAGRDPGRLRDFAWTLAIQLGAASVGLAVWWTLTWLTGYH